MPTEQKQDIFQVHKDLLSLIKNRPEDQNVPKPLQDLKDLDNAETLDGGRNGGTIDVGALDNVKTQMDDNDGRDLEKGNFDVPVAVKQMRDQSVQYEDFSVDYYDANHGLNKHGDDDLHNQILNELVLANDMAHKSKINQDAIDARMRDLMKK